MYLDRDGPNRRRWVPAKVISRKSKVTYVVEKSGGRSVHAHANQLRRLVKEAAPEEVAPSPRKEASKEILFDVFELTLYLDEDPPTALDQGRRHSHHWHQDDNNGRGISRTDNDGNGENPRPLRGGEPQPRPASRPARTRKPVARLNIGSHGPSYR